MAQRASPLAPFRHRVFRTLWIGSLFSNLGSLVQAVGAGWLMTSLTDSRDMVALVQTFSSLPFMIFALLAGALADGFERRVVMLVAQGFMMSMSVLLALLALAGLVTPWSLLAFTFLIGTGMAFYQPSWQASMGDIVPRHDLPSAVAMNSMAYNIMRSVGPAAGGFIVALAGAAAAFAVNALSYTVLIVAMLRWRPERAPQGLPREPIRMAVTSGLRYVVMSPNLINVLIRGFVFGVSAVAALALLPVVVREILQGSAVTYGFLLGAFGVGAIAGAFANARIRERLNSEGVARAAFAGFALGMAGLAVSGKVWLAALALMLAGTCWVLALSLFNVTVQLSTPRWVVGRAIALYQTATFGGMALGSWIWGVVAERQGAEAALLVAALALAMGALAGLWLRMPEAGAVDLDPLDRFSEPALQLDLTSRSGPIMVMVDYEIDQPDVERFLATMMERRRIRIRDGARQWALLRDLENPRIWTETYHVPTWVEYVRHHKRRTRADAEVTDRLLALHRGAAPPRVHRMIERQTVTPHDDQPLRGHPEVH